jgi:hypothetical protein
MKEATDSDGDGVPDHLDDFPNDANFSTDSDGDTVPEEHDILPFNSYTYFDQDTSNYINLEQDSRVLDTWLLDPNKVMDSTNISNYSGVNRHIKILQDFSAWEKDVRDSSTSTFDVKAGEYYMIKSPFGSHEHIYLYGKQRQYTGGTNYYELRVGGQYTGTRGVHWELVNVSEEIAQYSPTDITSANLLAWYDFSDSSTVSTSLTSNIQNVDSVQDKSSNNYTLTQTDLTQRPYYMYDGEINGLNTVNFTGDTMNLESTLSEQRDLYFLFVGKHNSDALVVGNTNHYFDAVSTTGHRINIRSSNEGNNIQALTRNFDEGDGIELESMSLTNAGLSESPFIIGYGVAGANSFIRLDGGRAIKTGTLGDETIAGFNLGNWGQDSMPMRGWMGEVIIFKGIPSEAEQEKLEGYLAHKWNTLATIPNDHPWKSTKPT